MKRVQYHRYGGPGVLALEGAPTPTPGRGQVLVRVHAAAANAMDWKIRKGEMRLMTGRQFPRGVGHDFAGVIERVGEGVTRLQVGDEVLGAARLQHAGAFAEFVIADQGSVAHKPEALTFAQAATLPVVGLTAYQAVTRAGRLQPGQEIFINGCLGGVGRIAVQVATGVGASVTGSLRSGSEVDAHQLGVATVVSFDLDPAPLSGRFDVVFDTAGNLPFATARRTLKRGGRIIDIVLPQQNSHAACGLAPTPHSWAGLTVTSCNTSPMPLDEGRSPPASPASSPSPTPFPLWSTSRTPQLPAEGNSSSPRTDSLRWVRSSWEGLHEP